MTIEQRKSLVNAIAHSVLPCPAAKLEFVSYAQAVLQQGKGKPEYEINLNTGKTISEHISFDSNEDPAHWFVLDIASASEYGISLYGPEFADVFPRFTRQQILSAMQDCEKWFFTHAPGTIAQRFFLYRCAVYLKQNQLVSKHTAPETIKKAPDLYGDLSTVDHALLNAEIAALLDAELTGSRGNNAEPLR